MEVVVNSLKDLRRDLKFHQTILAHLPISTPAPLQSCLNFVLGFSPSIDESKLGVLDILDACLFSIMLDGECSAAGNDSNILSAGFCLEAVALLDSSFIA